PAAVGACESPGEDLFCSASGGTAADRGAVYEWPGTFRSDLRSLFDKSVARSLAVSRRGDQAVLAQQAPRRCRKRGVEAAGAEKDSAAQQEETKGSRRALERVTFVFRSTDMCKTKKQGVIALALFAAGLPALIIAGQDAPADKN